MNDGDKLTMKRLLDFAIALVLIAPATVIIVVGALLVAIETKANPIFVQTRVGRHKKPFTLYKLRTMSPGTAHVASHEAPAASVTQLGKVLRRLKIDELPQLVCIIKGHMSLVGPRPCLFSQEDLIHERDRRRVFNALPGITGLAQVRGVDMSTPVALAQLDAQYIEEQSVTGDLEILWRTIVGQGRGDAAGA
jgi:O-antigen biosynthesis protein WbqP